MLYQLSYLARADKATQIKGEPDCSASFRATVEHETLHPEPVAALGTHAPLRAVVRTRTGLERCASMSRIKVTA